MRQSRLPAERVPRSAVIEDEVSGFQIGPWQIEPRFGIGVDRPQQPHRPGRPGRGGHADGVGVIGDRDAGQVTRRRQTNDLNLQRPHRVPFTADTDAIVIRPLGRSRRRHRGHRDRTVADRHADAVVDQRPDERAVRSGRYADHPQQFRHVGADVSRRRIVVGRIQAGVGPGVDPNGVAPCVDVGRDRSHPEGQHALDDVIGDHPPQTHDTDRGDQTLRGGDRQIRPVDVHSQSQIVQQRDPSVGHRIEQRPDRRITPARGTAEVDAGRRTGEQVDASFDRIGRRGSGTQPERQRPRSEHAPFGGVTVGRFIDVQRHGNLRRCGRPVESHFDTAVDQRDVVPARRQTLTDVIPGPDRHDRASGTLFEHIQRNDLPITGHRPHAAAPRHRLDANLQRRRVAPINPVVRRVRHDDGVPPRERRPVGYKAHPPRFDGRPRHDRRCRHRHAVQQQRAARREVRIAHERRIEPHRRRRRVQPEIRRRHLVGLVPKHRHTARQRRRRRMGRHRDPYRRRIDVRRVVIGRDRIRQREIAADMVMGNDRRDPVGVDGDRGRG